jgi:hypothetical protein
MAYYNSNPSPEELAEWYHNAVRRNAILPMRIRIRGRYTDIVCGRPDCQHEFTRKLLPNRNDPVYVCPVCGSRNYLPVEW